MRNIHKAAAAFAATGLLVGGIAAGGAFAKTTSGGTTVLNVPDGKSAPAVTAAAATVPQRVYAVVNADGTKLRGKAVASTTSIGTGTYDVRFTRNISTCAWTGTVGLGGFSGSTGPAQITITGRNGTNNGLFVTTFNGAGVATDEPFSAIVICG